MNTFIGIFVFSLAVAANALPHVSRVAGGSDAPAGKYPYQVSLWSSNHRIYQCGGSIINERYILTAAHCIKGREPNEITVGLGSHLLNESFNIIKAEKLIWHDGFDMTHLKHDIGLIRLAENIVYNDKIQPIKLPTEDFTKENAKVFFAGWGTIDGSDSRPNNIQEIELNIISNKECQKTFSITSQQICTLNGKGEGVCSGDSGSPLVDNGTQIGIVSYGYSCATGYPDVYARVFAYLDWIDEKMNLQ